MIQTSAPSTNQPPIVIPDTEEKDTDAGQELDFAPHSLIEEDANQNGVASNDPLLRKDVNEVIKDFIGKMRDVNNVPSTSSLTSQSAQLKRKRLSIAEKSFLSGKTPEEAFIAAEEETDAREVVRVEEEDDEEEEELDYDDDLEEEGHQSTARNSSRVEEKKPKTKVVHENGHTEKALNERVRKTDYLVKENNRKGVEFVYNNHTDGLEKAVKANLKVKLEKAKNKNIMDFKVTKK